MLIKRYSTLNRIILWISQSRNSCILSNSVILSQRILSLLRTVLLLIRKSNKSYRIQISICFNLTYLLTNFHYRILIPIQINFWGIILNNHHVFLMISFKSNLWTILHKSLFVRYLAYAKSISITTGLRRFGVNIKRYTERFKRTWFSCLFFWFLNHKLLESNMVIFVSWS